MDKKFQKRLTTALYKFSRNNVLPKNEKTFIENMNKRVNALNMMLDEYQYKKSIELLKKYLN